MKERPLFSVANFSESPLSSATSAQSTTEESIRNRASEVLGVYSPFLLGGKYLSQTTINFGPIARDTSIWSIYNHNLEEGVNPAWSVVSYAGENATGAVLHDTGFMTTDQFYLSQSRGSGIAAHAQAIATRVDSLAAPAHVAAKSLVLTTRTDDEIQHTLGYFWAGTAISLSETAQLGQEDARSTASQSKVITAHWGGLASQNDVVTSFATFGITKMSASDALTLQEISERVGNTNPLLFSRSPATQPRDRMSQGGVIYLADKSIKMSERKSNTNTDADTYEANGIRYSTWK